MPDTPGSAAPVAPGVDRGQRPGLVRLKNRADFLAVAAARRKAVMPGVVVQIRLRPAIGDAGAGECGTGGVVRVGFTASRKVGGAVERNRAKRRLRAIAASVLADQVAAGHDVVLIARQGTLTRSYADLTADVCRALRRLRAGQGAQPAQEGRS